jgi:hypothetical protein
MQGPAPCKLPQLSFQSIRFFSFAKNWGHNTGFMTENNMHNLSSLQILFVLIFYYSVSYIFELPQNSLYLLFI